MRVNFHALRGDDANRMVDPGIVHVAYGISPHGKILPAHGSKRVPAGTTPPQTYPSPVPLVQPAIVPFGLRFRLAG